MMKYLYVLIMVFAINCWSIPKPMESVTNYNVMLIHGAYGSKKGFSADASLPKAYNAGGALENGAALGRYHENRGDKQRLLHWLTTTLFEEPEMDPNH